MKTSNKSLARKIEWWLRRKNHRRLADQFRWPWWDWGHRLMALVGQDQGGSWAEPIPPTWYYRLGTGKRMWFTGYPFHPVKTIEVIKDYQTFRERTEGFNEDEMYEWKAFCINCDGELHLGKQYWGGQYYGMTQWEIRLLHKYLRYWRRLNWWGSRSWLYKIGLHAAAHRRRPFKCQAIPPKGSGGYSRWHCELPRRHEGVHRYERYEWEKGGI